MNYLKFGNSRDFIVFLHGWGADKKSFLWLKEYFSEYSLIFLDFPGFGESEDPKRPYYVSDYVCELKNLLDKFEIDSLVIVGHSFGGRVAIKFSFLYQFDYSSFRLCLVDSAGILPKRTLKYYFRVYGYKLYKRFFPKSKKLNNFGSSDYRKLSFVMKKTFIRVVNEDLSNYAKFIKAKTLIVWGNEDNETKMFMAKKLKKLIKNSELKIIDGAGHFSFLDKPVEFTIILDTFLKN